MIDSTIALTCLARHACRRHNIDCSTACAFYIDLRLQRELSGIPEEYADIVIERLPEGFENLDSSDPSKITLRAFAAVAAERKPRNGLFLTSPSTGNGKTFAACAIANSFIVARTKRAIASGASVGQLVQFVNTVELLDLLRQAMNDERAQAKADRLIERIGRAELVVLDDLGAEKCSPWVEERFYSIVNGIWTNRNRQTLIATSNKSLDGVELTLGERVRSRLDGLTVVMEFSGIDRRRKTR